MIYSESLCNTAARWARLKLVLSTSTITRNGGVTVLPDNRELRAVLDALVAVDKGRVTGATVIFALGVEFAFPKRLVNLLAAFLRVFGGEPEVFVNIRVQILEHGVGRGGLVALDGHPEFAVKPRFVDREAVTPVRWTL